MRRARALAAAAAAQVLVWSGAATAADGAKIFAGTCQACHQARGAGAPGLAPPLVSPIIANAAKKQRDYPAAVVVDGLAGPIALADGSAITSAMPPQQSLTDDEVAAVVTYVFRLNHAKTVVTSADIARLRSRPASSDEIKRMRSGLTP